MLPYSQQDLNNATTATSSFSHTAAMGSDDRPSRRGPWSQAEDRTLMELVATQGALNWVKISTMLKSRTPKQCRERYHQNLKPNLNHEPISAEEGAEIERLVVELGKRWAEIARRLHNRSDNAVKNWWNGSMNRRRRMYRRKGSMGGYDEPIAAAAHSHQQQHHQQHMLHQYEQRPQQTFSRLSAPAPLRLQPTGSYPQYAQHSPRVQTHAHAHAHSHSHFHSHPGAHGSEPWSPHSGMTSPSFASPGSSPLQAAPSLVSDNGSAYSTSPRSGGLPETSLDLPPLRLASSESWSPRSQEAESPKLPSMFSQGEQYKLPPIRGAIEDKSDTRMRLNNLLS